LLAAVEAGFQEGLLGVDGHGLLQASDGVVIGDVDAGIFLTMWFPAIPSAH
jgi:hypothetical protein